MPLNLRTKGIGTGGDKVYVPYDFCFAKELKIKVLFNKSHIWDCLGQIVGPIWIKKKKDHFLLGTSLPT